MRLLSGGVYKESRSVGFKDFLTQKMNEFNTFSEGDLSVMGREFKFCISAIKHELGAFAFSKHRVNHGVSVKQMSSFNAAVYDAIVIGFNETNDVENLCQASNDNGGFSFNDVKLLFEEQRLGLFENPTFFDAVSGSVNDLGKIRARITAVIEQAG